MQQVQIMRCGNKTNLSLGDIMDIVAEQTLPILPSGTGLCGENSGRASVTTTIMVTTLAEQSDPIDLSNVELKDINIIDKKTQCHHCCGYGLIAQNYTTPNISNHAELQFKDQKEGSHFQYDGSYSQHDRSLQHHKGHQQWYREHHVQHPPT